MNAYGELARDLWRSADQARFLEMTCPDDFFSELGLRVASRVAELIPTFAGPGPEGEPRRLRDVRLRRAKKQAEEVAYQELIFSQSVVNESEYADA